MNTQEEQITKLQAQVAELQFYVSHLYARLQLPWPQRNSNNVEFAGRTETGMGPVLSPDKSNYV